LAGSRLRARHACGRHGNLRLSADDTYANANSDSDSNTIGDAYRDGDGDTHGDTGTTDSDTTAAPNAASAADAVG
jgi:hypothetical protein